MKVLTVLCFFFLLLVAIFVVAWLIVEWAKRDMAHEKQYEADYKLIKLMIEKNEVNRLNFEKIDLRLANLKRLPFKNSEKTEIIVNEFCKKYGKLRCEKHLRINIEKQDK